MNKRNWLVLSDIHIGARKTTATEIIQNLIKFFRNFELKNNFSDLKCIFIAGDLFDDTMQFSCDQMPEFFRFWYRFTLWCEKKDIELILLEGTPKHDRRQGQSVATMSKLFSEHVKFKYINTLSIEYIESLQFNVLFVPDECRHTANKIYEDTLQLLKEKELDQVDIAIMHGMFRYQLGNIPINQKVHLEDDYLRIVKYYISIGHIHSRSNYDRIYAQGSFDRLAHGEEDDKGAYYFDETQPGEWTPIFLVNKDAKRYLTFSFKGDFESLKTFLSKKLIGVPAKSYIRILLPAQHECFQSKNTLSTVFPQYIFSIEEEKKKQPKKEIIISHKKQQGIALNNETIVPAILEAVKEKITLTPEDALLLEEELKLINH